MIPNRLPWRRRARPSATLHEIQVRSEERTCSDDATKFIFGRQEQDSELREWSTSENALRKARRICGNPDYNRRLMLRMRDQASNHSIKETYGSIVRAIWSLHLAGKTSIVPQAHLCFDTSAGSSSTKKHVLANFTEHNYGQFSYTSKRIH